MQPYESVLNLCKRGTTTRIFSFLFEHPKTSFKFCSSKAWTNTRYDYHRLLNVAHISMVCILRVSSLLLCPLGSCASAFPCQLAMVKEST